MLAEIQIEEDNQIIGGVDTIRPHALVRASNVSLTAAKGHDSNKRLQRWLTGIDRDTQRARQAIILRIEAAGGGHQAFGDVAGRRGK
jgi:hypothetical protein